MIFVYIILAIFIITVILAFGSLVVTYLWEYILFVIHHPFLSIGIAIVIIFFIYIVMIVLVIYKEYQEKYTKRLKQENKERLKIKSINEYFLKKRRADEIKNRQKLTEEENRNIDNLLDLV